MTLPSGTGYASDYSFTMRDAHRRPAQPIRPPAITWHLGFRRIAQMPDSYWYRQIEDLILSILAQCVNDATTSSASSNAWAEISNLHQPPVRIDAESRAEGRLISLFRNTYKFHLSGAQVDRDATQYALGRYETVVIHGHWNELPYWIRVEVFEEYFTITSTLELLHNIFETQLEKTPKSIFDAQLTGIRQYVNDRLAKLRASPEVHLPKAVPSEIRTAVQALFDDTWSVFKSRFFDKAFDRTLSFVTSESSGELADFEAINLKRAVFADFRGTILRVCGNRAGQSDSGQADAASAVNSCLDITDSLVVSSIHERIHGCTDHLRRDGDEANLWVEAILPLLLAHDGLTPRSPWHSPFEPNEYTFSTLGKGRFIYGSGFGSQMSPTDPGSPGAGSPLTYIVLAFHDDWRQIGRIILRLHTLGTLRLAALFELNKLMTRDQILLSLEHELHEFNQIRSRDGLRQRRTTAFKRLAELLPKILNKEKVELSKELQKCVSRIIQVDKKSRSIITSVPKFLSYRLSTFRVRHSITQLLDYFETLKLEVKQETDPDERTKRLSDLREAIRCSEIYLFSSSIERFQTVLLNQVRKSLTGMDEGIKDGITYRAARSTYARERYESLATAMQIERIRGFQPYDLFVRHRLDRAYGLIQAVDVRFKQVSEVETQLRHRLDREKSVRHQGVLNSLQRAAEIAFWCVLAPYYLGHISETMVSHWLDEPNSHKVGFYVTIGVFAIASVWYGVKFIRSRGQDHDAAHGG